MNKNTRRARAIAIAQAKPDNKLVAVRYFAISASALAAVVALLLARWF
ncbi:hypothetical protein J2W42_001062 [Rhizobium tibeticum]|uniref:Uncharacterized protein n=1 Tax=Rhizobium tibeticum TaxID=501024 RepID=A0A1H8CR71_9HYPH|nr:MULTISPECIES: hypothetical protein [Rhizobium]MCA0800678.1 hypothetical protein [Rhizobium sp. T1473]MCS0457392.1 hypothetical protein [Rhizobium favelukesii]MDP9808224.1 hypothetical protein [Rhizobium tibeticum]UFS81818.1 hypothetical protein LPB79_26570 [Rhizobium sp. T136]SEH49638.1 hypothetical protein RTCCBAU85039_0719 [Rhizobium tibeticum]